MSFAAFVLKLEADSKGVGTGVNTAIGHFKRLGSTVRDIEKRSVETRKEQEKLAKAAFERLKPEEQLNRLLRTREQIANRLARVDDPKIKNSYLQKQLELEKQIAAVKTGGRSFAGLRALGGGLAGAASSIPGVGGLMGLARMHPGAMVATVAGAVGSKTVGAAVSGASDIQALSFKTGLSTSTIQRLQFAANATDPNIFNQLMQVVIDIQKNRSQALLGDEGATKNFGRLGMSREGLAGMSVEDTAFKLFDMVGSGKINQNNMAAFFAVAEQGAKEILPALNRGLSEAARGFTSITKPETIDGLSIIGQVFREMWAGAKAKVSGGMRRGVGAVLGAFIGVDDLGSDTTGLAERLASKQAARALRNEANADADFMDEFDSGWAASGATPKTARRRGRGGIASMDTDEMARIGLFRGAMGGKVFSDLLSEAKKSTLELQRIRQEVEE